MNYWWFENKFLNIIYVEILLILYGDCFVFYLFIEIGIIFVIIYLISCISEF